MIIDGRSLSNAATLRADVVIVGAGPAGITLTDALAGSGLHVLLLERGPARGGHRRGRSALQGASVGQPFPVRDSRQWGFGGTSNRWKKHTGLRVRPLDTVDFEALGSRDTGWPFGREDLSAAYAAAYESVGLVPLAEDATAKTQDGRPLTAHGLPTATFQFADHQTFTKRLDGFAHRVGSDVIFNASVRNVVIEAGVVSRLVVASSPRVLFNVVARLYVLASGALENPRILLSSPGLTGAGVGNESDLVGRYFNDHISIDTWAILQPGPVPLDLRPFLMADELVGASQRMLWLGEDWIREHGALNAAFWVYEVASGYVTPSVQSLRALWRSLSSVPHTSHLWRHARDIARDPTSAATFALGHGTGRVNAPRIIGLRVLAEQTPSRDSRVRLSQRCDQLGMRQIELDWRVTESDLEHVDAHVRGLSQLFVSGGHGPVASTVSRSEFGRLSAGNHHPAGTTRMHTDGRRGVVDAVGRLHSVQNLFVTGSSVFPASGYVNPTLTIIALSIRLAETIRKELQPIAL